jgi:hypothetical protein
MLVRRALRAPAGVAVAATVVGLVALSPSAQATPSPAAVRGYLRVDQVGYLPGTASVLLMTRSTVHAATITVRDSSGRTVEQERTGPRTGWWSPSFPAVYRVALPGLRRLDHVEDTGDLAFYFEQATAPARVLDIGMVVPRKHYEELAAIPWQDLIARYPGIASGPHVSLLRLMPSGPSGPPGPPGATSAAQ